MPDRFQNALKVLKDCHRHIDDRDLSKAEQEARDTLIDICWLIADADEKKNNPLTIAVR